MFNSWINKKRRSINELTFSTTEIFKRKRKSWIRLFNYATKADLRNATCADTSNFVKKVALASLKPNVGKLDIDKLKDVPTDLGDLKSNVDTLDFGKLISVPVDLIKLYDVVKNDVVKRMYIMLSSKILKIKY